jgi:hypothetical protein
VLRAFFIDAVTPPGEKAPQGGPTAGPGDGRHRPAQAQGAEIVDPLPSVVATTAADNFLLFNYCQARSTRRAMRTAR